MTYTCRNCGHIYKGNEVDATGHTWGEWEVIKEATITETGKKNVFVNVVIIKKQQSFL